MAGPIQRAWPAVDFKILTHHLDIEHDGRERERHWVGHSKSILAVQSAGKRNVC